MKSIYNTILLCALALAGLASCNDFLDITPEGQVSKEDQLSTAAGVEDALYGVYSQLRSEELYGQELSFSTVDLMAQYFSCNNDPATRALQEYRYDNTDVQNVFEAVWTKMYNNISNVNAIINCDLLSGAGSYPLNIYRGEALGLRAFMHFDLLRLFGGQITENPKAEGIPYATEFSLNTPPFSSAADVYKKILADLDEAERLLAGEADHVNASSFMTDRRIHFNLYAVKATKARVYLTMGNKAKALQCAMDVIDHSGLTLMKKADITDDTNGMLYPGETVFGVYYNDLFKIVNPKLQQTNTGYSLDLRPDMQERYVGNDRRAVFFGYGDGGTVLRFQKLTDKYRRNSTTRPSGMGWMPGINLIRLPEMYFIAAECLLDTDAGVAQSLMQQVYDSRDAMRQTDGPITVADIDNERYRELIGEGQTFYNMKRRNLPISKVDGQSEVQPSKAVFTVPVPLIENDYRK